MKKAIAFAMTVMLTFSMSVTSNANTQRNNKTPRSVTKKEKQVEKPVENPTENPAVEGETDQEEKGEEFDTGVFKGFAPDGWKFFTEDENDLNQCSIYKGAEKESDMQKTAGINIQVTDTGSYKASDIRNLYKNIVDVQIKIEGKTWTGFTGTYNHYKNLILECKDGGCVWFVSGVMDAELSSFFIEDQDFQSILSSLDPYNLEITETPEPEITEAPEPEITEAPEPEITEAPEPEITEAPEPEITEAPEPEITEAPEPEITEAPEPEITEAPEPEITEAPEPEITEAPEPEIIEAEEETEFTTGIFKGVAPIGWKYFPVKDETTEDEDDFDTKQCSVYKGAKAESDMQKTAGLDITYYAPGEYTEIDIRSMYKHVEEIEFETVNRKWTGFIGEMNHYKIIVADCDEQAGHWSVTGIMEAESSSYTMYDVDFRMLLNSLTLVTDEDVVKEEPEVKVEEKHKHNYKYDSEVNVTCTKDGYQLYRCTECGATEKRNYQNAKGHNWERENGGSPSTCTTHGFKSYVCSRCQDTYREEFELIPHDYQYSYTVYPSCESKGYDVYNCSMCGDEIYDNYVYPEPHDYQCYQSDSIYHEWYCYKCGSYYYDIHYQSNGVCIFCGYTGSVG